MFLMLISCTSWRCVIISSHDVDLTTLDTKKSRLGHGAPFILLLVDLPIRTFERGPLLPRIGGCTGACRAANRLVRFAWAAGNMKPSLYSESASVERAWDCKSAVSLTLVDGGATAGCSWKVSYLFDDVSIGTTDLLRVNDRCSCFSLAWLGVESLRAGPGSSIDIK